MIYTTHTLSISSSDNKPIYAFVDEHGRTIAQAVGNAAAQALIRYLDEKV